MEWLFMGGCRAVVLCHKAVRRLPMVSDCRTANGPSRLTLQAGCVRGRKFGQAHGGLLLRGPLSERSERMISQSSVVAASLPESGSWPATPGRPARFSEAIWNIDWNLHLPLALSNDELSVEFSSFER